MEDENVIAEGPTQKLVAFVVDKDGQLSIRIAGMDIKEAHLIVEEGRIKLLRELELFFLRTIK